MPTNYPCYLSILGDSSIDHFQTLPTHLSFCEARKVLPTKLLLLSSFLLPIYGVLLLLPVGLEANGERTKDPVFDLFPYALQRCAAENTFVFLVKSLYIFVRYLDVLCQFVKETLHKLIVICRIDLFALSGSFWTASFFRSFSVASCSRTKNVFFFNSA